MQAERAGRAGAGPDSPLDLSGEGWKATARRTLRRIVRDRVTVSAGSLAYHLFLAMFPAVIAGLGVLTLVHVSPSAVHRLTDGLARALPSGAAGVFKGAVTAATKRSSGSLAAVVLGVGAALWSVSSALAVLQQTLDVAYEVPVDRKFLARRLRAVPLMVVTAVLGLAAAILIVFGAPIGGAISGAVPIAGGAFTVVWTIVRWVVALALISVLFSVYYYWGPNRESPRWQWVSPGGVLAAAVFLVASLGFSFYTSSFGSYGKTYGSFAGVAILIFWLYLTGLAVLVGGEINAEIEREAAAAAHARGRSPAAIGIPDAPPAGGAAGAAGAAAG